MPRIELTEGRVVVIKCLLFFLIALFTPVSAVLAECAVYGYWPPAVKVASAGLGGLVAGLVAVRAFLDGSNERYEQRKMWPTNGGSKT